ncbi:bifunctional riboflavin kinase/FAD synthetase [Helicobacter sp. 11S02629-2]|uniref:bifunctional riboflavin kinase/FAD synthetase n=1 Tax=Helicobacter sp. 11S02629-2 TaxID=1476195 RepID=UPI000BA5E043|nr:bifunctional riboflavin kinase/FAD synthetase [Helicobacter sp. 11S02629-2]PAF45953.1 hypothetical protein BKH40_00650 [Helicobacter sp. 11S02629-2]
MESFLASSNLPYKSVAIGKFDSMHMAHLKLFSYLGKEGCILSISSYTLPLLLPFKYRAEHSPLPIFKIRLECIKHLSGEEFIRLLTTHLPRLELIVVGYDFTFGRNKSCSVIDLKEILESSYPQIRLKVLDRQNYKGLTLHTSLIKSLIKNGNVDVANKMLGRIYEISGKVIRGQGLGKKELYPTINMRNILYIVPLHGVYATLTYIEGKAYPSVSFIGHRVSTDNMFCIETHLIDTTIPKVSGYIKIGFIKYLRANKRYKNLEELRNQISKDIIDAKKALESCQL